MEWDKVCDIISCVVCIAAAVFLLAVAHRIVFWC